MLYIARFETHSLRLAKQRRAIDNDNRLEAETWIVLKDTSALYNVGELDARHDEARRHTDRGPFSDAGVPFH